MSHAIMIMIVNLLQIIVFQVHAPNVQIIVNVPVTWNQNVTLQQEYALHAQTMLIVQPNQVESDVTLEAVFVYFKIYYYFYYKF